MKITDTTDKSIIYGIAGKTTLYDAVEAGFDVFTQLSVQFGIIDDDGIFIADDDSGIVLDDDA